MCACVQRKQLVPLFFILLGHNASWLCFSEQPLQPLQTSPSVCEAQSIKTFFSLPYPLRRQIQLLILDSVTESLDSIDCRSVVFPSASKHYFASIPFNYFLVGDSLWKQISTRVIFPCCSSKLTIPFFATTASTAPLPSGHLHSCFLPTMSLNQYCLNSLYLSPRRCSPSRNNCSQQSL